MSNISGRFFRSAERCRKRLGVDRRLRLSPRCPRRQRGPVKTFVVLPLPTVPDPARAGAWPQPGDPVLYVCSTCKVEWDTDWKVGTPGDSLEAAGSETGRLTMCRLFMRERLAGAYQPVLSNRADESRVAGGRKRDIGEIHAEQGVGADRRPARRCRVIIEVLVESE